MTSPTSPLPNTPRHEQAIGPCATGADRPSASTTATAAPTAWSDYKTLTKPSITRMVVITAAIGFIFGLDHGTTPPTGLPHPVDTGASPSWFSSFPWLVFCIAMLGTALSCMAASVFNQVIERDTDALMHRTRNRPIAAGRVATTPALWFGAALSVLGLGLLAGCGLYLACALCALTIASYALVYTPLKRWTSLALLIGAVPGALPPMIGYAASGHGLGPAAWLLFAIMFVWQVPHFLAIAWLYRDDYARADLAMLPVIDPTGLRTFQQTLIGCLLLLPLGIIPSSIGLAGHWYFAAALICGLFFLGLGVLLVLRPTRQNARRLFLASLIYLPVVLIAMLIDRT